MYTIGELSQHTGVHRETIRYYERIGILPVPHRAANGYRQYSNDDLERLNFIHSARKLDFSINDIADILSFREQNKPPCQHVMSLLDQQIIHIQQRIEEMKHLKNELVTLYKAGKNLPEDVQMKDCVCHLIRDGITDKD